MANRNVRRSVAVLALSASLLAVAGCDVVKAGSKCKATSGPGRDATHVLFCQGGKWTRVMTIGQAADFIMSTWPSKVELVDGGGQTTGVGEAFGQVSVRVTRKDGQPVKGADVVFKSLAESGASLAAPSGLIATDADGIARFTPRANDQLGGYGVSATVNGGTSPYVIFGLNNGAAPASSIVVVGGGGAAVAGTQASLSVKAVDRFGNLVQYKQFEFSSTNAEAWFGPAEAFAGEDGIATTTMGVGNHSGVVPVTVKVAGSATSLTFDVPVVAGAIDHTLDFFTGDNQTANASSDPQFPNRVNNPLNVGLADRFGNPAAGRPVTFTINANAGAGGTFDVNGQTTATFMSESDGIAKGRLTGNGVSGSFTVEASFDGRTHTFTVTNP